ncbi:hypothetical protein EJ110_NYTH20825 [Nymphaea thermarum]|nr:hypothetical protein EJ110_NYTH20825 [Nymphaea thermarum]
MGSGKNWWRISFHFRQQRQKAPPLEFLCPISNAPMADPAIVPSGSGQTFERRCIEALLALPPNHHLLICFLHSRRVVLMRIKSMSDDLHAKNLDELCYVGRCR